MYRRLQLLLSDPERGDVPGWVLVTIMSAALVVAIFAVASTLLPNIFENAVSAVADIGG
jgi:hypothetical protein